ncbi:MAG TPA: hypothetical protein VEF04_12270 [Blastocatellia bacterium]|nr:hypothetical protein [Blastocatellia bacterium]
MGSEWAKDAERQAEAATRDLIEVGKAKGFRVTYQKREARFALRAGATTSYFSAKDYEKPKGMDWLQLRIDILTRVKNGGQAKEDGSNEDAAEDNTDSQ